MLSSPSRHRLQFWPRPVAGGLIALMLAGACRREPSPCEAAYARESWKDAVGACGDAYAKARRPDDGARLAQSLAQSGDLTRAAVVASSLLGGPRAVMG